jgi:chromosome segregation ATPase
MKVMKVVVLFLISGFASVSSLQADPIKCWTNEDGVMECGNFVPPEYSQQGYAERNEQGVVVKKIERAKTPEEIAALKAKEDEQKALEQTLKEQEENDRELLMQFSTEDDIDTQKTARLSAIDGVTNAIESYVGSLKGNLEDLESSVVQGNETIEKAEKRQAEFKKELASLASSTDEEDKVKARQKVINDALPKLQRDIDETIVQLEKANKDITDIKYRIKTNEDTLTKKRLEKESVEKQYTDYLMRFREIMQRRKQVEIEHPVTE